MGNVAQEHRKLPDRLLALASEMEDIAGEMFQGGGPGCTWQTHAEELMGAAGLCHQWAQEIGNE